MNSIYTQHMKFVDENGRERIFNGINFVHKGHQDPLTHEMSYIAEWNEGHFQWCKENGFNLIRLGMIWDGIEHEKGVYNEAYLDWIEKMLDLCKKYEIYAFLDMHQDLYSCIYGDGAPEWATLTEGKSHITGDLWSDAYLFSEAVKTAFENFWTNKIVEEGMGLQDYYVKTWMYVIERLKDHPALIGYDFINEPFPGGTSLEIFGTLLGAYAALTGQSMSLEELVEAFSDPSRKRELLKAFDDKVLYAQMAGAAEPLVKLFDTQALKVFYQRMTTGIRQVTDKGIIMMENCYFSNLGIPCNIPVLKNEVEEREPLQAYAPHGYDLVVDTADIIYASNNRVDVIFDTHRKVQERLQVPVVVGEWGAHSMYQEGLDHIEYLLNKFNQYKWSQTYWCYHENIENAPVMTKLKRTYPQAISGEILTYKYDYNAHKFELEWEEKVGENHLIYVHEVPKTIQLDGEVVQLSLEASRLNLPCKGEGKRYLEIQF